MTPPYATWRAAETAIQAWAADRPVYWGTGAPIHHAQVVASTLDAWSGAGCGYYAVERTAAGEYVRAAYFYVA